MIRDTAAQPVSGQRTCSSMRCTAALNKGRNTNESQNPSHGFVVFCDLALDDYGVSRSTAWTATAGAISQGSSAYRSHGVLGPSNHRGLAVAYAYSAQR